MVMQPGMYMDGPWCWGLLNSTPPGIRRYRIHKF